MIVSLGEALIDALYGDEGAPPRRLIGGSPYNVAIALARLDVPSGLICPLSTDEGGDLLHQGLLAEGVSPLVSRRVSRPTAIAEVRTDAKGHPSYTFHREGTADRALDLCPPADALPTELEALHFGSLTLAQADDWPRFKAAVKAARHRGAFVAFDPNLRPALIDDMESYRERLPEAIALSDLVKASDEDLELLEPGCDPSEVMASWRSDARTTLLTQGAKGAQLWTRDGGHVSASPLLQGAVVDTVGAGDTFQAALLAWRYHAQAITRDLSIAEAKDMLEFAVCASGLTCQRAGCQPPRRQQVIEARRAR